MKVVIIGSFPDKAKRNIIPNFPTAWQVIITASEEAEQHLRDADVVIPEHVKVNGAFLDKAPQLKLVQTGAGFDNVDISECTRRGVQVCNATGVNATAVAEHTMALILGWYKNIVYLDNFVKSHGEGLNYTGSELDGKTIGIIGLGAIGKKVAGYCNAFGMNVLGYNRSPVQIQSVRQVDLNTLCSESDVVTVHVPLRDSTHHMVNRDVLDRMKPDSLLVNTSRGAIVNEAQLVQALKERKIGGACLDVYEEEPITADNPLRNLQNVILTPHTAGLPDGVKYHKKRYEFFVNNITKVMNGETPDCALNKVPIR